LKLILIYLRIKRRLLSEVSRSDALLSFHTHSSPPYAGAFQEANATKRQDECQGGNDFKIEFLYEIQKEKAEDFSDPGFSVVGRGQSRRDETQSK
jgi:hypothetical protein